MGVADAVAAEAGVGADTVVMESFASSEYADIDVSCYLSANPVNVNGEVVPEIGVNVAYYTDWEFKSYWLSGWPSDTFDQFEERNQGIPAFVTDKAYSNEGYTVQMFQLELGRAIQVSVEISDHVAAERGYDPQRLAVTVLQLVYTSDTPSRPQACEFGTQTVLVCSE